MATPLDVLLSRLSESGLLDEPVAEEGVVRGRAVLDAAGSNVTVRIDPELEEDDSPDLDTLIAGVTGILSVTESQWRAVVEATVAEIEDAVADTAVAEQVDLRDDLEATSIVVFADAVVVRFAARRQFPDSRILVQLDEDLDVETVEVEDDDAGEYAAAV